MFGRLRGAEWFAKLAEEVPAFVFDAQASTMEKFLATLTERWGDAAGYLQSVGVARDDDRLARRALLRPADAGQAGQSVSSAGIARSTR